MRGTGTGKRKWEEKMGGGLWFATRVSQAILVPEGQAE